MVWIYILNKKYQYYYTTGRWGYVHRESRSLPEHHYHSRGIEDLFDRFLNERLKQEENMKSIKTQEECLSDDMDVCDEECGEVLFIGKRLINSMPRELMIEFKKNEDTTYHKGGYYKIVRDLLTREKAVEKYGEISDEEFGPLGGWKSVTFGNKKFVSKFLKKEKIAK